MRRFASLFLLSLGVLAAGASFARQPAPVAVSPGTDKGAGVAIAQTCPSFSWSQVPDALSYELRVFRITDQVEETSLEQKISAAALSWTPPLSRCLQAGERYAWTVRAETAEGYTQWSEPSLFEVTARPAEKQETGIRSAIAAETTAQAGDAAAG